jgi:2,4-dienoyl-CoA reductase-like NADH-dependent reductase (Old Yellow Enzyme family)
VVSTSEVGASEDNADGAEAGGNGADPIFEPLHFRNLTVKNRVFRSNIAGRFDNYDGSGTPTRINWELKFARGGVGAIISSFVPVTIRGRIVPNYATIHRDEAIPFWREVGARVHDHDCRFILQLSHAGRQRDIPGLEYAKGLSSTDKPEPLHGFEAERMTRRDIADTVRAFAEGARRAREAGLDGVELHAQTAISSRSSSPRRSTTATMSTAGRSRTGPASSSRSCAPSAQKWATISICR